MSHHSAASRLWHVHPPILALRLVIDVAAESYQNGTVRERIAAQAHRATVDPRLTATRGPATEERRKPTPRSDSDRRRRTQASRPSTGQQAESHAADVGSRMLPTDLPMAPDTRQDEAHDHACQFPVMQAAGRCCRESTCSAQWARR